jgi:hypothetical protein
VPEVQGRENGEWLLIGHRISFGGVLKLEITAQYYGYTKSKTI